MLKSIDKSIKQIHSEFPKRHMVKNKSMGDIKKDNSKAAHLTLHTMDFGGCENAANRIDTQSTDNSRGHDGCLTREASDEIAAEYQLLA